MQSFRRRHTHFRLFCISALLLISDGCSRPERMGFAPKSAEINMIRELVRQRRDAGNRGDVTAWVDCFTDDAILMPANTSAVIGKESIEEWERGFKGYRPRTELNIDELILRGDWAYMRSSISDVFVKDDERFPIAGKEIAILRRVEGHWKFHRLCGKKNGGSRFEKVQKGERTR